MLLWHFYIHILVILFVKMTKNLGKTAGEVLDFYIS